MYELTELLSSWWGAVVVLGLILVNAVVLTGYWSRYQLDRRLSSNLSTDKEQERTANIIRERSLIDINHSHFFGTWSNRIYFILTMGCALLLVSLPLFPIESGKRFFLWLALTASTLFGSYRLYLSWRGRDERFRSAKSGYRSREEFAVSLDQLSENEKPLRLLDREEWLDIVWREHAQTEETQKPISFIGFFMIGHDILARRQNSLPADRVSVLVGDAIVRALRDEDHVCMTGGSGYFCMLKDCSSVYVPSIGDRITARINQDLLSRATRIYGQNLTLVYVPYDMAESIDDVKEEASGDDKNLLWEELNRQSGMRGGQL